MAKSTVKVNAIAMRAADNSPANMIREAVAGKANLEQLKGLLDLQKEFEANIARKEYASAFSVAQANIQGVVKTKINPQTHSKYADLSAIIESAQPIYTKEGFSMIFYEGETSAPEHIRVCVDVLHRAGHKETYHYDMPLDGVGIKGNPNMTKIHGKSSSVSYGRRYLTCMIWNIPTKDDDGNAAGNSAPVEYIGDKELNFLRDNFIDLKISEAKFLEYMKVEKLEDITKTNYPTAVKAIETKRQAVKK